MMTKKKKNSLKSRGQSLRIVVVVNHTVVQFHDEWMIDISQDITFLLTPDPVPDCSRICLYMCMSVFFPSHSIPDAMLRVAIVLTQTS